MTQEQSILLLILFTVAAPTSVHSQDKDFKTRNVEVKYSNATLLCEVLESTVSLDIDNTKKYYWYSDLAGDQNTIGGFAGALLHGKREVFDEHNRLINQTNFHFGLKDGEEKFWNNNGELTSVYHYRNGICYKGTIYEMDDPEWDKNHYVIWEYNPPDLHELTDEDRAQILKRLEMGDPEMRCLFCVGLPGCVKTTYSRFYPEPRSKQIWLPNQKDIAIVYYENSNQIYERIIFDWFGTGKYEAYHKNGKLKTLGQMLGAELKGEVKHFDEQGALIRIEAIE